MIALGVDIGGTGCKCVAFSSDGQQLALAYREYPLTAGTVDLPPQVLRRETLSVIRACVEQLQSPADVAAVTVSSFGESFVAVDADGEPLTDILMYFANAADDEFSQLVRRVGEEPFMRIARILPDASYSLAKMLYTRRTAARPVAKFLFVAGYLCRVLCGANVCDVSLACRSLLYDVQGGCWSRELLEVSGIREEQLPTVLPTGGVAGTLLPEIAAELGLSPTVKVVIGSHDQIVNALGAGVRQPGDAVDTSGTCECITPLFAAIPDGTDFQRNNFACVPYLGSGGFVTYAYNISGGSVIRWYRDALGEYLRPEAEKRGCSLYDLFNEQCPAEPTQLLMLPFLQGMGGTPDVDAAAAGMIAGLTTQTRLPEVYRAVLESVSFEMRYNREKLREAGVDFDRLLACGGGARSRVWLQIKADVLGCDIIPVLTEETGAMGSAVLGIAAVTGEDIFAVAKRFWRVGEAVRPIPAHQAVYEKRYEMYKTMRQFYVGCRKKEQL